MWGEIFNLNQINFDLVVKRFDELYPIQYDYEYQKVLDLMKYSENYRISFEKFPVIVNKLPIVISSDNRIIDGHHKYMIAGILNPKSYLLCIRLRRKYSKNVINFLNDYIKNNSDSNQIMKIVLRDIREITPEAVRVDFLKADMVSRTNILSCDPSNPKNLPPQSFSNLVATRFDEFKKHVYSGEYKLEYIRRQLPQFSLSSELMSYIKLKLNPTDA